MAKSNDFALASSTKVDLAGSGEPIVGNLPESIIVMQKLPDMWRTCQANSFSYERNLLQTSRMIKIVTFHQLRLKQYVTKIA